MRGWTSIASAPPDYGRGEFLYRPLQQHLLGLGDRLGGVEALRAGVGAVHDRVAAIEPERIFELVEPLALIFVAAVGEPAIGLEQDCGPQEAIAVPPIGWAGGRTAGAEDAFVEPIQLGAIV